MDKSKWKKELKQMGLSDLEIKNALKELEINNNHELVDVYENEPDFFTEIYDKSDLFELQNVSDVKPNELLALKTLDELLEHDKQREKDGFPRRIKIGKMVRPSKNGKQKIVVIPTTWEPKFYHDNSVTTEGEGGSTGGSGQGEEGEVIGEQQAQPQQGEGEGHGAGKGGGGEHEVGTEAYDLGKVLTEKFNLPNLKDKGKKRSLSKFKYDLTDINRGFGQLIDKKATLKRIVKTNIMLGNIVPNSDFSPEDFLLSPQDHVYRIMSREKDYETQAMVFFVRDYSGSMQGAPTEAISTQHMLIYSWLVYQYKNNVETKFILHDTEAKEVPDFDVYHRSNVAGGTKVAPAFSLINKIVEQENLASDYNIYIFYGTDGDDWDSTGKDLIKELNQMIPYVSRIGITVAKNSWGSGTTTVEKTLEKSGLLKQKSDLIRLDSFKSVGVSDDRIIESIKKLIE
jgi:uncharacterized sporulation protein YeaH/YhbH (DUF444 family)